MPGHADDHPYERHANLWTRLVALNLMQQEAAPALELLAQDRRVAENHLRQLGQTNAQVAAQRSKIAAAAEQRRAQGDGGCIDVDRTWMAIESGARERAGLCSTGKARKVVLMRAIVLKSAASCCACFAASLARVFKLN